MENRRLSAQDKNYKTVGYKTQAPGRRACADRVAGGAM
jgi:hypothetical protein